MRGSRSSRRSPTSRAPSSWRSSAPTTPPSARSSGPGSPMSSRARRARSSRVSVDTAAGWSTARMDGMKEGLATNPDLEFVGPINTGIEPGQMYNAIQNAMTANPGAIAIASVDCCSIDGAAKWVETADKSGKVLVIGTDALQQTLNYIKKDVITFSLSQDPVGQVFTAISQLKAFVTDGTPPQTTIMPAAAGEQGERGYGHPRGMITEPMALQSPLAVVASGLCKRFPGCHRPGRHHAGLPGRTGHRRGGRERRRQVDPHDHHGGPAAPGRGHADRRRPRRHLVHAGLAAARARRGAGAPGDRAVPRPLRGGERDARPGARPAAIPAPDERGHQGAAGTDRDLDRPAPARRDAARWPSSNSYSSSGRSLAGAASSSSTSRPPP